MRTSSWVRSAAFRCSRATAASRPRAGEGRGTLGFAGPAALRRPAGSGRHPAADVDALRDLLLRVSRLADEIPEIIELDLNPVIALPDGHGCRIVAARAHGARGWRGR